MEKILTVSLRIGLLLYFLCSTIDINFHSVAAFLLLTVSLFVLRPSPVAAQIRTKVVDLSAWNPLKKSQLNRRKLLSDDDGDNLLLEEINRRIIELVVYDAETVNSLKSFSPVQFDTQCIFAKTARVWGSCDWLEDLTLEENVIRCVPTFFKFTCLCLHQEIDGFLFQLPGRQFGSTVQNLGAGVRRLLLTLSRSDPCHSDCMKNPDSVGKRGWVFEFNHETFFITTFAPCYPLSSPRSTSGLSDDSFVFFQPESSFARHDLPADSPDTDWDRPRNIRDRIRVAFRDAGRPYRVPDSIFAPMAYDVVRPLNDGDEMVEWWKPLS